MTTGRSDIMAQAVYLAQLEAARGQCKCRTCQILRKANKAMVDQFLAPNPANPPGGQSGTDVLAQPGENVITLDEEE